MGQIQFNRSSRPVRLLSLGPLLVLAMAACSPAYGATQGETGTVHSGTAAGLAVTIDTRWLCGVGYRPVQITVRPTVPTTVDRTLTVQMQVDHQYGSNTKTLRVTQEIDIPAGSGAIQATLAVPETFPWGTYRIHVLEDGQTLRPLSFSHSCNTAAWPVLQESFPAVLIVADNLPDTTQLVLAWPMEQYAQYGIIAPTTATPGTTPVPQPLPTAMARPVSSLPLRWIEYSSLDVVCISLDELTKLKAQRRTSFDGLLAWTVAGGNLWVYGVGTDWQQLSQLESLVDFPRTNDSDKRPTAHDWREPDRALFNKTLQGIGNVQNTQTYLPVQEAAIPQLAQSAPPFPDRPHFLFREYSMGLIVALAPADPFPSTTAQWQWLLNATGSKRWLRYQREGLSTVRANADFWNFLIPGIGLAPVTAFIVLISLFALMIGPVNYLLLRHWKRLHLMLLTTPAAAIAVTLALFAYAIVADGLSTRVRLRSVTRIDQRHGQAVCWARQSYYSGLAPSTGMRFPDDIAVLPLEYQPMECDIHQQEFVWQQDQWLASGYLTSRRPTQYLTLRSRPSSRKLELREPPDEAEPLPLTNRLGTQIEQLLIRTEDGKYYWASDVAADAAVQADPVDPVVASQRLQKTFMQHVPTFVLGMDQQSLQSTTYRGRLFWWANQTNLPDPIQSTSMLETALTTPHVSASTDDPRLRLGSYLAVVRRSPEVELGVPEAEEQASFHVILGTW